MLDSQVFVPSPRYHAPPQQSNWRASAKIDVNITFTFTDFDPNSKEERKGSIVFPKGLPPPLFSPHVLDATMQQINSYKSGSYTEKEPHLAAHMVANSVLTNPPVLTALYAAGRFNFHVEWTRKLDIYVHEGRSFGSKSGRRIKDTRVKLTVGSQIERTRLVNPDSEYRILFWNETFSFIVRETTDIHLLSYSRRAILPNTLLGRTVISPKELVERSTVTKWFPLDTDDGEVKMSISLSPPWVAPFRFSIERAFLSSGEFTVRDAKEVEVFMMDSQAIFSDAQDVPLLNIKHRISCSFEIIYDIYRHGQFAPCMAVKKNYDLPERDSICVMGLQGVDKIITRGNTHKFYNVHTGTCVAFAQCSYSGYNVEINPDQDVVLILAAVTVVAKILQQRTR
eukprot:Phypoly_transcript_09926.p1 GENE.Phypoly_transcript_09926~~Phypoly_transcript_09926.p1  ORF type:complete len:396 (+),score=44.53 Phypoly_transcript_09926:3-1190(+)